jgi:hypothetical protein
MTKCHFQWPTVFAHLLRFAAGESVTSKKQQVADPFLPDRTQAVFSDWPKIWYEEDPSIWMFRIHWLISDVAAVQLEQCQLRQVTKHDIDVMRSADDSPRLRGVELPRSITQGELGRKVESTPSPRVVDPPAPMEDEESPKVRPISYAYELPPLRAWHTLDGAEMPWVLVVETPPNSYIESHMYANRIRHSVELSLRLVSGKPVFVSSLSTFFQSNREGSLSGQYGLLTAEKDDVPDEIKLHVTDKIASTAQVVHSAVLNVHNNRIRMALARFRRSYSAGSDTLIDHWIGLEAIFGDGSGEITYKAAMRLAHFVGYGPRDRTFLFRALIESYKARSALVHGSQAAATLSARLVASYALRTSLLSILLTGREFDVKALDDSIAAAGA